MLAAVGVVVAGLGTRAGRRVAVPGLLVVLAGVFFVVRSKADWMREWRFLVPFIPCLAALGGLAVAALCDAALESVRWKGLVRSGVAASLLAAGWALVVQVKPGFARAKASPEFPAVFVMGNAKAWQTRFDALGIRRPLWACPTSAGWGWCFGPRRSST